MGLRRLLLLLLLLRFALPAAVGASSVAAKELSDDVLALMVFKADVTDPTGALRSWNEDDDNPCAWTGVSCDAGNGRVTALVLDGRSLSGRVGRSLAKLHFLQTLSLSDNNLSAATVSDLADLRQLSTLNLAGNALSGPLLADFDTSSAGGGGGGGGFPALQSLDLSRNAISDPISAHFGDAAALRFLNLSHNRLSGAIPDLQPLRRLSVFDASFNSLSGPLLSSFPATLTELHLQSNRLSGALSDNLQRLQGSLVRLNLADNFISGKIPAWISGFSSLQLLNVSFNALQGEIPAAIGDMQSLQVLDLSRNGISGELPGTISGCARLIRLEVSSNRITGSIPADILQLPELASLSLADNRFVGPLPSAARDQCSAVESLDLSRNWLHGSVAEFFSAACATVRLRHLNLSYNIFSGGLPEFLPGTPLSSVDLSHNRLTGRIPATIGVATRLVLLSLSDNKLSGVVPPELGNITGLQMLDLSDNDLGGAIPPELGNITGLQMLDLSQNNLSGGIPAELGLLRQLVLLNVSYNHLQGPIPADGNMARFNKWAFIGNSDLCGAGVNVTCPTVMPKPIVLNPNSTDAITSEGASADGPPLQSALAAAGHRHPILLSASAILAISAAAAISAGVIVVFVLNAYARGPASRRKSGGAALSPDSLSGTTTTSNGGAVGKLVMFSSKGGGGGGGTLAEEWATALFDKDSELGRGGFGTVYKAVLADGRTVAIKKLTAAAAGGAAAVSQRRFEKEMKRLGRIRHKNLVALQGYYWAPQMQLLIYDFVPNGSVHSRLHDRKTAAEAAAPPPPLGWEERFKIAVGAARGLAHLHHGCQPPVIHYNMKSSNVLLDEAGNAKVADYGLQAAAAGGGGGGVAAPPEVASQSARISDKCDVYGYGVMLLELVTGKRPVEYTEDDVVILCDYVRSLLDAGRPLSCVDSDISTAGVDDAEILPLIKLGLICTSQVPSNRPSMAEVVQILELIRTPTHSKGLI